MINEIAVRHILLVLLLFESQESKKVGTLLASLAIVALIVIIYALLSEL
jgi:hypothetical protein